MRDRLIMSKKERQRKTLLDQIEVGYINRQDAAKRLSISERQLRRIIARYRKDGDEGLVHKSRGRRSNRAYPAEKKEKVLKIYEEKYSGFGPTFAAEKFKEINEIEIQAETLRLWLKKAGLWKPHRKRKGYRSRRERRARYGELLQLDGSIHEWFEGESEKTCLMNIVDDATGKTLALMDYGETTRAAFALLKWWISEAGIPLAIYVDLKSIYVSPKSLRKNEEGELIEPEWLTHFSRACKRLGIEVIKAYSPQAKGRVERSHGVYQDRLVKEMKLRGIKTIEEANKLLSDGFVNELNKKFAKPARSKEDAHVPTHGIDLDDYLCWTYRRQVKNDWTVQYKNKLYQIEKTEGVKAKEKIEVRCHIDGSLSLWSKGKKIEYKAIEKAEKRVSKKREYSDEERSKRARENKHKSPWSRYNPGWLKGRHKAAQI